MFQLAGTGTGSLPVIRAAVLPVVLLLALVLPPAAAGQILYGSLTGTVTDQTGGALPGAKVDITNPSTGVVRSVVTDERGSYLVADLQPGTYDITIDLAGFRPVAHKGTVVVSNSRLRLDARLEISAVTDTVAVTREHAAAADRACRPPDHADRAAGQRPAADRQRRAATTRA